MLKQIPPIMQAETVFVIECFFPPYLDGRKQRTPGRWVTCYDHVHVMGGTNDTSIMPRPNAAQRKMLERLKLKAQGYTGRIGALNLHHNGLAYIERADAHEAVKLIRKWKCCKYKVRVVRETVWKECVICKDDPTKDRLQRPFYWPPGYPKKDK